MANLTDSSSFDPVYQLETTDPVLAGPGGIANRQAQNLANRTKFLQDAIAAIDGSGGPFDLDASGGVLPTAGSGPGGAIKRKDQYRVTVAGTFAGPPSTPVQVGDQLIARIDNATLITDYIVLQGNAVLATPTVLGLVKLVQNIAGGSTTDQVLSLAGLLTIFAQLASPTLTGNPTTPDQTAGNNSGRIANTKYVDAAVAAEATARANADSSEATARSTADTALANALTTEATTRTNADTSEASTRAAADTALQTNIDLKGDKNDATAWNNLALASGVTAGSNIPQYRINQFGKLEFRGSCSGSITTGGPANFMPITIQSALATAIDNAINSNSYYVSKFLLIPVVINIGTILTVPCPANLVLNAQFHQMSVNAGEFNGAGFPSGTYAWNMCFDGISVPLT